MLVIAYGYANTTHIGVIDYLPQLKKYHSEFYIETPYVYYGGLYPYGGFLGSIGKAIGGLIHGVGKAIGSAVHAVGKAFKYVAPIAVPLVAGVAVSGALRLIGAGAIAKASAASVAAAVEHGAIGTAVLQSAALATKVALTHVASQTLLRALGAAPKSQPAVVAVNNRPAVVVPAFVRELVEPHHLVAYATNNGKITSSRLIQERIDWLAKKIQDTVNKLAQINRECGLNIDRNRALRILRRIFWDLPPTKSAIEQRINTELNRIKKALCCNVGVIRNLLTKVFSDLVIPQNDEIANLCVNKVRRIAFSRVNEYTAELCPKLKTPSAIYPVLKAKINKLISECIANERKKQMMAVMERLRQIQLQRLRMQQEREKEEGNKLSIPQYIQIGNMKIPTLYALGGLALLFLLTSRR